MKTVHTRLATYVTGSDLADAVLTLAAASANARRVEVVDIPVVAGESEHRARFMVGWMAEVSVHTLTSETDELEEPTTLIDLLNRSASAGVRRARPFTPEQAAAFPWLDLDLDPAPGPGRDSDMDVDTDLGLYFDRGGENHKG